MPKAGKSTAAPMTAVQFSSLEVGAIVMDRRTCQAYVVTTIESNFFIGVRTEQVDEEQFDSWTLVHNGPSTGGARVEVIRHA